MSTSSDLNDVRSRIKYLCDEAKRLNRADPACSRDLASEALDLAQGAGEKWWMARSLQLLAISRAQTGKREDALDYLSDACGIFGELKDSGQQAEVRHSIALIHGQLGRHDQSIPMYEMNIGVFESLGKSFWLAMTLQALASACKMTGEYARALDCFLRAIEIFEKEEVSSHLGGAYFGFAVLLHRIQEYDTATDYFGRSMRVRVETGDMLGKAMTHQAIGALHFDCARYEEAMAEFVLARDMFHQLGHHDREANSMNSIGLTYTTTGRHTEALHILREGLTLAESHGGQRFMITLHKNLGNEYWVAGRQAHAMKHLHEAVDLAQKLGEERLKIDVYQLLATWYEETGDYARALDYYKLHAKVKERLIGDDQKLAIQQVRVRHEMRRLEREREIEQLKAEHLEHEMQLKNRELASVAMELAQKNEMLMKVGKEMRVLKKGITTDSVDVIERIEGFLGNGNNWETFAAQFNAVHGHFISHLSRLFPELTPTEVKICCLLRVNLSSKDVASMLCISVRTVEIHRGRIRKKLRLDNGGSLATFIAGL